MSDLSTIEAGTNIASVEFLTEAAGLAYTTLQDGIGSYPDIAEKYETGLWVPCNQRGRGYSVLPGETINIVNRSVGILSALLVNMLVEKPELRCLTAPEIGFPLKIGAFALAVPFPRAGRPALEVVALVNPRNLRSSEPDTLNKSTTDVGFYSAFDHTIKTPREDSKTPRPWPNVRPGTFNVFKRSYCGDYATIVQEMLDKLNNSTNQ